MYITVVEWKKSTLCKLFICFPHFTRRFSTRAVETFLSSKAAMILCTIKPASPHSLQSATAAHPNDTNRSMDGNNLEEEVESTEEDGRPPREWWQFEEGGTKRGREEDSFALEAATSQQPTLPVGDSDNSAESLQHFALNLSAQRMLPRLRVAWKERPMLMAPEGEVVLMCGDRRNHRVYRISSRRDHGQSSCWEEFYC